MFSQTLVCMLILERKLSNTDTRYSYRTENGTILGLQVLYD